MSHAARKMMVDRLCSNEGVAESLCELVGDAGWLLGTDCRQIFENIAALLFPESLGPPNVGVEIKCIICALEKPWGVWDSDTGAAVCAECRDRARSTAWVKLDLVQKLRNRLALSTNLEFNMVGLMIEYILDANSRGELGKLVKDVLEFQPKGVAHDA